MLSSSFLCADTISERLELHWDTFKNSLPGSAILSSKLELEELTLENFQLDTEKEYTIVSPGEQVIVEMDYHINTDMINSHALHHYVYGLDSIGPIDCLTHSFGFLDREGHIKISFSAPKEKGIYELRILKVEQAFPLEKDLIDWKKAKKNSTIAIIAVD